MAANMNFLYESITNKICKMLEEGTAPWTKTWSAKDAPQNLTTKIPYRGINTWNLLASPFATTKYWLTWNQIIALKGRVKTEENKNYEIIVFWKQLKFKNAEDNEKSFPMIRYTRVYNLNQCEFSPETLEKLLPVETANEFTPLQACENIVFSYKDSPPVDFGGDRAYYQVLMDKIQMPHKIDFKTPENYYATLFHEFAHSTGSEKRLKRFKATDSNMFGSEVYSKEELVAELTASFLCAEAGIENTTIDNSASYIQGWLKAIKNSDKNFIISAASKASYASEFILGKRELVETE